MYGVPVGLKSQSLSERQLQQLQSFMGLAGSEQGLHGLLVDNPVRRI